MPYPSDIENFRFLILKPPMLKFITTSDRMTKKALGAIMKRVITGT
jgi:hypothetical protein